MSSEATPAVNPGTTDETPPGMGGPTTEETGLAVGEEGVDQAEPEVEGGEPEATVEEGAPPPEKNAAPDPAYIADLESRVRDADMIARIVKDHPERLKQFEKWAREESGEVSESDDPLAGIAADVDSRFDNKADRDAVHAFVDPLIAVVRDLQRELREIKPKVGAAHNAVVTTEIARTLASNGVPEDVQQSKEFRKFMAAERSDRDMARDLAKRPLYAARNLAARWVAQNGRSTQNAAVRQRVAELKGGRFYAGGSNTSGTTRVVTIDKSKPGWDTLALQTRLKNPGVTVKYTDGAKGK